MQRAVRTAAYAVIAVLALPSVAMAQQRFSSASFGVHVGLSALGLVVAVVLLVEALAVRRLASGGVMAQRIGLVVLAVICLAASALADWGTNFVVDLTLEQVELASEVLVIVAMALLAGYFWNIRAGMSGYLVKATAEVDEFAEPPAPQSEPDEVAEPDKAE